MEPATVTVANVLTAMGTVLTSFYSMFSNVIGIINDNKLLLTPVLFALAFSLIMFAIGVVRRLGVRGVSSAGGRRHRRRG